MAAAVPRDAAPSAKKLVGTPCGRRFGSQSPRLRSDYRTGGITKQGRKELRAALVEATWITVRFDHRWRDQVERLAQRIDRRKAIVATPALRAGARVACKLLVVIWHVLSHQRVDRQADLERVVRYILAFGRQAKVYARLRLKASAFARQQLDILGIGQELSWITFGATHRRPPSTLPVTDEADNSA